MKPTHFVIALVALCLLASTARAARVIDSVTVNGANSASVSPGDTVSVAITVTTSGSGSNDNWDSVSWTLDGTTTCRENDTDYGSDGTYTETFDISAPAGDGNYDLTFYAHRHGSCNPGSDSNLYTLSNALSVSGGGGGGGGGGECSATFQDLFSAASYSNSDGDLDWASDWSEIGDNGNVGSGDVDITGGELHLQDDYNGISRSADLSAYNDATLSFDYDVYISASNESFELEIRSAGGSWTTLHVFQGALSDSGTLSFDITAYTGGTVEVRFMSYGPMENGDDLYIDNFTIEVDAEDCEEPEGPNCDDLWSHAIANTDSGGAIEFFNNARAINSPNDMVATTDLIDNAGNNVSCDGVSCTADPVLATATTFSSFPSGPDLYVHEDDDETFAPGDYDDAEIEDDGILRLQPGDYTFASDFIMGNDTQLFVQGSGTVRLWVQGRVDIADRSEINDGESASQLFIYSNEFIDIDNNVQIAAFLYSTGGVEVDGSADVTGAVSAADLIEIKSNATVTYDLGALNAADFGDFCSNSSTELDHYAISLGATASTCAVTQITIRAEDSSNQLITDYSELVAISTSSNHGNWAINTASGSISPDPDNDDNGAVDYQFIAGDGGDIILDLSNSHAESLTITVSNGLISSTSAALTFSENAFVISEVDSLGEDVIAGRNHDFRAQMMRRDPVSGDCGVAAEYNVGTVKAWYNPDASDPGGAAPSLVTASETRTLPAAEPGNTNLTLPFINGEAWFSLATSDVGRYSLSLKDDGYTFSDEHIATLIPGDSPLYTVRPFGFAIEVDGNPAASSSAGNAFTTAGADFELDVTAVAWNAADDSDDDGVPDGHDDQLPGNNSDLTNNTTLPSFGQEAAPATLTLDAYLVLPDPGSDPGLSGTTLLSGFNNGAITDHSVSFDEVGIIEISAAVTSGNYLSAGNARTSRSVSRSGFVGRFIPHHFNVDSGDVPPACVAGGFTYLQQPFTGSYSVSARNLDDSTTQNYDGDFVKLGNGDIAYYALDVDSNTVLGGRLSVDGEAIVWSNGTADVDLNLTLQRLDGLNSQDGPFTQTTIGIAPTDDDGVSLLAAQLDLDGDASGGNDSVSLGMFELRYARLVLDSAHGPESANLPVNFAVEFWNGSRFITNPDDNCSTVDLSEIDYPDGTLDSGDFDVSVGAGTSTGTYANLSPTTVGFSTGSAGQVFTAPGVGNTGAFDVDVDLSGYPWLQYDWDRDGSYLDNIVLPTATFSFGSYRGHDRIIYWREILD